MEAPPRSAPIKTGLPAFALPWPIYPRTIFSGSGELASKRGGAWGAAILMVKLLVKLSGSKKTACAKKIGKSEGTALILV